jgi:hypothetical protein
MLPNRHGQHFDDVEQDERGQSQRGRTDDQRNQGHVSLTESDLFRGLPEFMQFPQLLDAMALSAKMMRQSITSCRLSWRPPIHQT